MNNILILRSAVLGDFIISSPAINFIREKNPGSKIYLLAIPSAHKKDRNAVKVYETKQTQPWLDFIDRNVVDEIIPMKSIKFQYLLKELRPLIKCISPQKCYILTDPLVKIKGSLLKYFLMRMIGVKCSIYGWKDFVLTKKEKKAADENYRCVNHTLSCLESVFEDKDIIDKEIVVKFPIVVSQDGNKQADNTWKQLSLNNKKVIVLSPGGIKPHKIWPIDNYVKIIKYLLLDPVTEILLTGTKKDEEFGKKIISRINDTRIHNLIAKTDLQHLAGILKKSNLLIGNDGGTMHLGDAVGCNVIAIMPGLELPNTVEPWHNMKNCLRGNVKCSPCYDFDDCPNGTYKCMECITADSVIEKIKYASQNRKNHNEVKVRIKKTSKRIILKQI